MLKCTVLILALLGAVGFGFLLLTAELDDEMIRIIEEADDEESTID